MPAKKKSYTCEELAESLRAVGIGRGSHVVMHSSLMKLGALEGVDPKDAPKAVIDTVLSVVGEEEGTLIVPTFSWTFYRGQPHSVLETPCDPGMGNLSEILRVDPRARRTGHPGQNWSAIGKLAEAMTAPETDTVSAWDNKTGPARVARDAGAVILMLGYPNMNTCSFTHYVEELAAPNCPYRFWKDFTGPYTTRDGVTEERTYSFYARDLKYKHHPIFEPALHWMREAGLVKESPVGRGAALAFTLESLVNTMLPKITADPGS